MLRERPSGFILHEPIKVAVKRIIGPICHHTGYVVDRKSCHKVVECLPFAHSATLLVRESTIDQDEEVLDTTGVWFLDLLEKEARQIEDLGSEVPLAVHKVRPAEQLILSPGCVEAVRSVDGIVDHLVEIALHQRIPPIHDLVVDFGGQPHKAPRVSQIVETAKSCRFSFRRELEHLLIVERGRIAGELGQALWAMVAKGVRPL